MAAGTFVAYYRVSTAKQGASRLGLEAQRAAVQAYLNGGSWKLAGEFTEVESGKRSDRPELAKAIETCRLYGARLVIAKLDRLSRDIHFLTGLERSGIRFVAADMPEANEMIVHIMAVIAQAERKMIGARTKAALQAAKARGTVLGGFRGHIPTEGEREAAAAAKAARAEMKATLLSPIIADLRDAGITSANGIAKALTERSIPTARGGSQWSAVQVQRVVQRLASPQRKAEI